VASSSSDGGIHFFNLDENFQLEKTLAVNGKSMSFGSSELVIGGRDGMIHVFDWPKKGLPAGKPKSTWKAHDGMVHEVEVFEIAGKGKFVISGGEDKAVKVWRMSDRAMTGSGDGHKKPVNSVSVNCDGTLAASGGADKLIKIWKVQGAGTLVLASELKGHSDNITSVRFHPMQRNLLLSTSWDRSYKVNNHRS
jgi:WD40 repeat protein